MYAITVCWLSRWKLQRNIYIPDGIFEPPYKGAKDMLLVERVDSAEYLTGLFKAVYEELPAPKKKKQK